MGAIQGFGGWYDSWVGSGVYMHVLAAGGVYRPFYVGKSVDIGRRWREHVVEYLAPKDGFWAPENAGDFLADPIGVMNGRGYAPGLANRAETMQAVLAATWFCFAEVEDIGYGIRLDDVEYVVQEGVKRHWDIEVEGYIGDGAVGRQAPTDQITVQNHMGRSFLVQALPPTVVFTPGLGVYVP